MEFKPKKQRTMKKEIHLKLNYPYAVDVIWKYLTDADLLKQWSTINKTEPFKAEVGFKWIEKQKPRRGWDGIMYLEVLEVIPQQKLSYSLKGGPKPGELSLDTVVTYTLIANANGTELRLSHTGFQGFKGAITAFIMEKGWGKFFNKRLNNVLKELQNDEHSI
jgi:uncharacterized protein YndB with AHSA1/START domain